MRDEVDEVRQVTGWHHSRDCRISPSFPHCNCGAEKAQERLDQLEAERTTIERLIEHAEDVGFESATSRRYTVKMVSASDLSDVLSGVLR